MGKIVLPDDFKGTPPEGVPKCYAGEIDHILITESDVHSRLKDLAQEVAGWLGGEEVTVLCVLKGAFATYSTLVSALRSVPDVGPIKFQFIRLSSYSGTASTGTVSIVGGDMPEVRGKNVLVVEDIVDTGHTAAALKRLFSEKEPKSLKVLSLLHKRTPKSDGYVPDYVGFEVPDRFVIGFGLDYNQFYRDLPFVAVISQLGIDKHKAES